jgi:hypothetical protein
MLKLWRLDVHCICVVGGFEFRIVVLMADFERLFVT